MNNPQHNLPLRNPLTARVHRREVWWQIWVPLLLGGMLLLSMAVLTGMAGKTEVHHFAQISIIWLVLPLFLIITLALLLVGALIFITILGLQRLPPYFRLGQEFFYKIEQRVKKSADMVVEPVLKFHSLQAGWKRLRLKR